VLSEPFRIPPRRAVVLTLQLIGLQIAIGAALAIPAGLYVGIASAVTHSQVALPSSVRPVSVVGGTLLALGLLLRRELVRTGATWRAIFPPAARILPLLAPFALCIAGAIVVRSQFSNVFCALLPPPDWALHSLLTLSDLAVHPFSAPLILVVIAPVTEELFFRALLLRGLRAVTTAPRALLVSTLLFTAIHLNPWQSPTAFGLGLLFGWIYLRTRSIALCIAGHACNNAVVLLATGLPFVVPGFNSTGDHGSVTFQPGWFNAGGVVALLLGLWLLHRRSPPLERAASPLERPLSLPV
jgi:membrane protease YdiL (CAAX protease family)